MGNVVLVILLLLALALTVVVLMQRTEGGGLGMGSDSGLPSGRSSANTLTTLTWILGIGFMVASLALTVIAARESGSSLGLENFGNFDAEATGESTLPAGEALLPPTSEDNVPLVPLVE